MPDTVPWREKYGTRYVVNAALLTVVLALGWLWFTAHVKPHVSTIIFSGFSALSLGGVALVVVSTFFDKADLIARFCAWLKLPKVTPWLLGALPLLAFAYATTFTLYLAQADGSAGVRLSVSNGATPTPVELTSAEKVKAVSYFFACRAVTARVETLAPTGFRPRMLALRRGIPLQLTVPVAADVKPYHLVRLIPLYNLIHLRGNKEPDARYTVRVYLPGRTEPIVRRGLTFNAIYLGAGIDELQPQSKSLRTAVTALRDTLRSLDESLKGEDIDAIVAAWLDTPEFLATPELAPGDTVRVELESPAGKTETKVKIAGTVNDAFLEAAEQ
jgi:hypothetical protein